MRIMFVYIKMSSNLFVEYFLCVFGWVRSFTIQLSSSDFMFLVFFCFSCSFQWYPEIKKYCPNIPIVLVGCKMDLRNDIGIIHASEGKRIPVSHDKVCMKLKHLLHCPLSFFLSLLFACFSIVLFCLFFFPSLYHIFSPPFWLSSETELRLIFLQYCDLPPLITVEDRQSLSSEKLAWPAVSSPTAEISVYQRLPLLQDFLQ